MRTKEETMKPFIYNECSLTLNGQEWHSVRYIYAAHRNYISFLRKNISLSVGQPGEVDNVGNACLSFIQLSVKEMEISNCWLRSKQL